MPSSKTSERAPAKAKALSLHIGLNGVSAAAYSGWDGPLAACEFDANDMAALAASKGIRPTVLLTRKATRAAVLAALRSAAKALKTGDLFFMRDSGHGGQVPDTDHDFHARIHARIRAAMQATQSPNLFVLGSAAALSAQTPFTV